jgi:hypothetical protein
MTDDNTGLNDQERAHTAANLELASRFIRELLNAPEHAGDIPEGAALVLMPEADPELAFANIALADRLSAEGQSVIMQRVGIVGPARPEWQGKEISSINVRQLTPHWAGEIDPEQIVIVYDANRDVLWIDFFGGNARQTAVPRNGFALVTVNLETKEAFGYIIPSFVSHAVRKVTRLAQILAVAELRPLTTDELSGIEPVGQEALDIQPATPARITVKADLDIMLGDIAKLGA